MDTQSPEYWHRQVEFLLQSDNLDQRDRSGMTILHHLVRQDNTSYPPLVNRLLRKGADPNMPDYTGLTPLHIAAENGSLLLVALLLQFGAKPNTKMADDSIVLHACVRRKDYQMSEFLCLNGANPNAMNAAGKTPKILAAELNDIRMFGILEHYADKSYCDDLLDRKAQLIFGLKNRKPL